MREIEIRRHSCTKKGSARGRGSHLSQDGVQLAREVAAAMGEFDLVITSPIPRTIETAIAMGFAVDDTIAAPDEVVIPAMERIGHHERWGWEQPWARFAEMVRAGGPVAGLGACLREEWTRWLEAIPDRGRLLVVSHGRDIETGVVTCQDELSLLDFGAFGEPLHQCEGVRMSFTDGCYKEPILLRARRCRDATTDRLNQGSRA